MSVKKTAFMLLVCTGVLVLVLSAAVTVNAGQAAPVGDYRDGRSILRHYTVETLLQDNPGLAVLEDGIVLKSGESLTVRLDGINEEFCAALTYEALTQVISDDTVTVAFGDDTFNHHVHSWWRDEKKTYDLNRYGNEEAPLAVMVSGYTTEFLSDAVSISGAPRVMPPSGALTITNNNTDLRIRSVTITTVQPNPQTDKLVKPGEPVGSGYFILEAEDYALKSEPYISAVNVQDIAVYPYASFSKKLNCVTHTSKTGAKLVWYFVVGPGEAGNYKIAFRYSQTELKDLPVYRRIAVDGVTLSQRLDAYPFPYRSVGFQNEVLQDESGPLEVYLTEGEHSITLVTAAQPTATYIDELQHIVLGLNDIGLDMKRIAGATAGSQRTWDIEQYIPGVVGTLYGYKGRIDEIYENWPDKQDEAPSELASLKLAVDLLEKLLREPEKLPSRLSDLSEGSGSAASLIGGTVESLKNQEMRLDRIYVYGDAQLPKARAGLASRLWEGVRIFFHSVFSPVNEFGVAKKDSEELNIWVARPIGYLSIMQNWIDTQYTPLTGQKVRLSTMPDERKIVLANATDTTPDVVTGIYSYLPFEYALRGAAADLTQFSDFRAYAKENFNASALQPYVFDGGIYAVPETQDFFVLFYRKDILEKLNIPVPDTWDDVKNIMPILRRNSMNFYIPVSGNAGMKYLYGTMPFIVQAGGSLYSGDGFSSLLNTELSFKGFTTLTELYRVFSFQENIPNFFNNFSSGIVPIGVDEIAMYTKLKFAAPELAGLWAIAPSPGTLNEDGAINRAQTASNECVVIMERSDKKEAAWDFVKWWMSEQVQTDFAYTMQMRLGPGFFWNTANRRAFEYLPFSDAEKAVIREQWRYISEVPRHPAGYMTERELSDAFLGVIDKGISPRVAIDEAVVTIDREIMRKLTEYGYAKDGVIVKPFSMISAEEILNEG